MNFNKAIILGNLTRDPETRALPSGQSVVNFSIATNRIYNDKNNNKQTAVEFHNIVAFGKLADICSRYLNKGKMVLIEGRIQNRSWQGQDGVKKYRTEIIAENMQLGPRGGGDASGAPNETSATRNTNASANDNIPIIDADAGLDLLDEEKQGVDVKDIPF